LQKLIKLATVASIFKCCKTGGIIKSFKKSYEITRLRLPDVKYCTITIVTTISFAFFKLSVAQFLNLKEFICLFRIKEYLYCFRKTCKAVANIVFKLYIIFCMIFVVVKTVQKFLQCKNSF